MSKLRQGHVLGVVAENPKHAEGLGMENSGYITTIAVHEPVESKWFTRALGDIQSRLAKIGDRDPIWRDRSGFALESMGMATIRLADENVEATIVTLRNQGNGCPIDSFRMEDVEATQASWAKEHNTRLRSAAERLCGLVVDAANMYQDPEAAQRHLTFLGHAAIPASSQPA